MFVVKCNSVCGLLVFSRFALVCVGSESSSRKLMDQLSKRELHGQNPIVTPCNKQSLSQFEMQSRKSKRGKCTLVFCVFYFIYYFKCSLFFSQYLLIHATLLVNMHTHRI